MENAKTKQNYKNDSKEYRLDRDRSFLTWYKEKCKKGYDPYLNVDDIQKMVNTFICWFELMYPNESLHQNSENTANSNSFEQLKFRLQHNQLETLNCEYRSNCGLAVDMIESYDSVGEPVYSNTDLEFKINCTVLGAKKHIYFNGKGLLSLPDINYDFKDIFPKSTASITIDDFYQQLIEKKLERSDFSQIEKCIERHNIDKELRGIILNAVSMGLICSKNTTKEEGLIRSSIFINELRNYFPTLDEIESYQFNTKISEKVIEPSMVKRIIHRITKSN